MSLINKMLKDLETRDRTADSGVSPQAAYEDLRPIGYVQARPSRRLPLLLAMLVVVIIGAGGFYFVGPQIFSKRSSVPAPVATRNIEPAASAPDRVADQAASVTPLSTPGLPSEPQPESRKVAPLMASSRVSGESTVKQDKSVSSAAAASTPRPVPKATEPKSRPPATTVRAQLNKKQAVVVKPKPDRTSVASDGTSTEKTVIEKRDVPVGPQEQAEARYQEAARFVSQGRAEDARAALAAALAANPAHRKARELAAALAMQNGHLREAQDLLVQGMKVAPDYVPFAMLLARLNVEQGLEAQAITTLESARAAGAGNADYFSLIAALYQRVGRHADAVKAYRETVALRAQDARAWLGLGISLEATQDTAAAGEAYQRALQLGGLDAKLSQYAQQRLAAVKK